ncbi:acyl-CoA dehydrogenase family protein [Streptomyces telluris]|uniref:Acyl-CoA dehydrogenase family protein n=1 Tax=Streptomyces telluris TaxID=2720021 RepID=A0A9X2LKE0_9ACTN|nr:acyl-CoA dehydrogenase [Streptomyces telluris]MCQ8772788.1 acyl-CoA dehydrogenase family protein [Streptomyces telluris]
MINTPSVPAPRSSTAGALTHALFGPDAARVHEPWRRLVAGDAFRRTPGLSPARRAGQAYERLHLVNAVAGDPLALAADPHRLASLHEWAAVVDGSLATVAGIHYNLFLGSLLDHGAAGRSDTADFTALRRIGTFLCTELEHGNDAAALRTTATYDRATGGFVLHTPAAGAQKFMPNTSPLGGPKSAVVAARLVADGEDHGVFLFLTPLTDANGTLPGVRVRPLPERTGGPVDHCLTSFDRVRLPWEALLADGTGGAAPEDVLAGRPGNKRKRFLHAIGRVTVGKLCMSACGVGGSRAALAIAVRYAHHRHISGSREGQRVPLAAHRSHHARLLDALATTYAMTFLHRDAVRRWAEHQPHEREAAERHVAIVKGWITWQTREVTLEARERCGAQGLFPDNGLAEYPLNIEGAITAEGDNLAVWVKAAAEMIFDAPVPAPRAEAAAAPSPDDSAHLRALLAAVATGRFARARARLREGKHPDQLSRWNAAVTPALEAVAAHAALQAADAFLTAVEQVTDPAARALLGDLCRLFLLGRVRQCSGELLAAGATSAELVRALPDAAEALTASLAPHMTTLVDAFALPEEFLSAVAIANPGYAHVYDDPEGPWHRAADEAEAPVPARA